jgi:hypothetical protein
MRLGRIAVPLLIAAAACSPVRRYQEAARSLRFSLDRVEPSLELALPLDRSRVRFEVTVGVENPSTVPFHLLSFEGGLSLETTGELKPLGQVTLLKPMDLPAGGKSQLLVALSFGYKDLADRWPELQAVLGGAGERPGSWELSGTLRGEVGGITVQVPVRTRHPFGAAP